MLNPPYVGLTKICMSEDIHNFGWEIGNHTYGNPTVLEKDRGKLYIGKFCSIAKSTIILGSHEGNNVSTYPFDALKAWWPGADEHTACHTGGDVIIGSDVWIGEGAIILPKSNIGHGAIIGAGTVIRGFVPPYSISIGNPAIIIKYRFEESLIKRLISASWWDLPDEKINKIIPILAKNDVNRLLEYIENT